MSHFPSFPARVEYDYDGTSPHLLILSAGGHWGPEGSPSQVSLEFLSEGHFS
jgi:hypothetical protein